jgi:diaminopimelate decarboxylase
MGLRVNPGVVAGYSSFFAAGAWDSRFGIPLADLPHALSTATHLGLEVQGVHLHTGSSGYKLGPYLEAVARVLGAIKKTNLEIDYLNIGGGWGISYAHPDDETAFESFPLADYAGALRGMLSDYGLLGSVKLFAEPGEYLIGPCGYLLCRVRRIVQRRDGTTTRRIAIVDGGTHLFPGAALYDIDCQVRVVNRSVTQRAPQILAGRSMLAGDMFGPERDMPLLEEGDLILIGGAGAYSYAKSSRFNSLPEAGEILI